MKEVRSLFLPDWKGKSGGSPHFIDLLGEADLDRFLNLLPLAKAVSVDTETSGLDVRYDHLVGMSACVKEGPDSYVSIYLPIAHKNILKCGNISEPSLTRFLQALLNHVEIVMHNCPFDIPFIQKHSGVNFAQRKITDTLYYANIFFPYRTAEGSSNSLKALSCDLLDIKQPTFEDTFQGERVDALTPESTALYAQYDAYCTLRLFETYLPWLNAPLWQSLPSYYEHIEFPNLLSLLELNRNGVPFNLQGALVQEQINAKKASALELEVFQLSGSEFDLQSPPQVRRVFFGRSGRWHLRPSKRTEEEGQGSFGKADLMWILMENSGVLETDWRRKDSLEKVFDRILKCRYFLTRRSKVTSFLEHACINFETRSGRKPCRIYGSWRTSTMAGRFSCTRPSLLGIPHHSGVRELIQAPPGKQLVGGDFSQMDFRSLSVYCESKCHSRQLTEAFERGEDMHWSTTKRMYSQLFDRIRDINDNVIKPADVRTFKKDNATGDWFAYFVKGHSFPKIQISPSSYSQVYSAERKRDEMKRVNFGLIYGMSAKRLADYMNKDAEVDNDRLADVIENGREISWYSLLDQAKAGYYTVEKAQLTVDRFFELYPAIPECIEKVENEWIDKGYITNIFGRPLSTPLFSHPDLLRPPTTATLLCEGTIPFRVVIEVFAMNRHSIEGKLLSVHAARLRQDADPEDWATYDGQEALFLLKDDESLTYFRSVDFEEDLVRLIDPKWPLPYVAIPHKLIRAIKTSDKRWIKYPGIKRGQRQIFSYLIASTTTDMCRMAMIFMRRLIEQTFKTEAERPKLIMCVHDELVYEVEEGQLADDVRGLLERVMSFEESIWKADPVYAPLIEEFVKRCPMKADIKKGRTYADLKG